MGVLCGCVGVFCIWKKVNRVRDNLYGLGRDAIINQLCMTLNASSCLMAYNILTLNPLNIALTIIATKFGLSKMMVMLILAFVL